MRHNHFLQRIMLAFASVMFLFSGLFVTSQTVDAKELTNVVTSITLYDKLNGREITKVNGTYDIVQGVTYAFEVNFDLSKYDGNLSDGDKFTLTIPAPMTIKSVPSEDVVDPTTKVAIGTAVVTSNGENRGGTVTITLKNLQEYLKKKGGAQVQGVKGLFFTDFVANEIVNETTIAYQTSETAQPITHKIRVKAKEGTDYSGVIGKENFAKIGGVIAAKKWTSETLGISGDYVHPWSVRVNTRQQAYDTIRITDTISTEHSPMQFIPETLEVYAGTYLANSLQLDAKKQRKLVQGQDYFLEYNSSYTSYVITINNASDIQVDGKPAAFRVIYDTTSPADGSNVANSVEVTADGTPLTTATDRVGTVILAERNSKIAQGYKVQIQTGYRLTIYKVDSETNRRLPGAVFRITAPDGTAEEVTTSDEEGKEGLAQSKVYSEALVKQGKFRVEEITAPVGYVINSAPFEVTIGQAGAIRTIKNKQETISIPVTKIWEGDQEAMRPEAIVIQLLADGEEVSGKTLELDATSDWKGSFTDLPKMKDGKEIVYTIKEEVVPQGYTSTITGDVATGYTVKNTYTAQPVKVTIEAKKTLKNRDLLADEFSFKLAKEDGEVIKTVTNDGAGDIKFPELSFDKAGIYNYTITEVKGTDSTITYDETPVKVTVTVKDNGKGQLEAQVSYDNNDKIFENIYTPTAPARIVVKAHKSLDGKDLVANQFSFTLTDKATNKVYSAQNAADGSVSFEELTFDKEGTFEFELAEVKGNLPGIVYDETKVAVTIEVTKEGNELKAQVITPNEPDENTAVYTFKNKYQAKSTTAQLSVTKVLTGRELKADEFSFTLTNADGEDLETVKNTDTGVVAFSTLTYVTPGEFTYTIKENKGEVASVTYDEKTIEATVKVVDDGQGQLKVEQITYKNGDKTFNNSYTAAPAKATIQVAKSLTGRELKADEFSFTLTNADGEELETVKNTATGEVAFSTLTYVTPGEFTYTIKENKGKVAGVTYDEKTIEATVKVVDDGQGQLKVEQITYKNDDKTFNNTYTATSAKATIQVAKSLTGRELKADEFSFTLTNADGEELETVKNTDTGVVAFSTLTYVTPGEFTYTIKENKGEVAGVTYDEKTIEATVKVVDDGQGQLKVEQITYKNNDNTFNNSYTATPAKATIQVAKSLTGRELMADEFSFTLTDESGKEIETVTNDGDGNVTFGELTFDKVGKYTYKVKEVKGTDSEITYDSKELTITITVTDNGQGQLVAVVDYPAEKQFVNEYVTTTTTASTTASTTESTTTTTESTTPSTTESTTTTTASTTPSTTESTTTTTASTTPSMTESTTTTTASTTPSTTESTTTTTASTTPSTTESTTTTTASTTASTTESTTTTTESTTASTTESTTTTTESTTPSTTESTTTTTESTTPSTTESTTTTTEGTTASTTESTTTTTESTTMTTVSTSGGSGGVTTTNVTPKGGSSRRRVTLPSTGEANGGLFIVLGTVVLAAVGYGLKRHRR
ncbi:Spy0128 family protein [Streptococcus entericus]